MDFPLADVPDDSNYLLSIGRCLMSFRDQDCSSNSIWEPSVTALSRCCCFFFCDQFLSVTMAVGPQSGLFTLWHSEGNSFIHREARGRTAPCCSSFRNQGPARPGTQCGAMWSPRSLGLLANLVCN